MVLHGKITKEIFYEECVDLRSSSVNCILICPTVLPHPPV